jgi:hypothetical protein
VRVAIFVAVVAAHLALLWLVTSLHRWVLLPAEDEAAITPIFLPPLPPEIAVEPIWEPPPAPPATTSDTRPAFAPSLAAGSNQAPPPQEDSKRPAIAALEVSPGPAAQQPSVSAPTPSAPDWRAAAEVTAQTSAQHIVEAEDDAARKAAALTSRFKPLPGPRVRGPEFAWDYAHTHRITPLERGGFVIALNDRCAIAILPLPMFGCAVGRKSPANGDLFKYMHPPVKFGDWDWRLPDP